MIWNILILIFGLALILGGANYLTDGASAVAQRSGISPLVIGLTIVAFGTSAPELVISCVSAFNHNAGIAIGNVVGSNIFNILVIIGLTALVRPIKIERGILVNDIPLVILSSLVILVLGNGVFLDGDSENIITRSGGLILLLFFCIFLRYTFSIAKSSEESADDSTEIKSMKTWVAALAIVGGLGALIWGGQLFVDSASAIARSLNVSDAIIGLTIVAFGTSLPELATSIVAAVKNQPGLAVGNVVGSCIFNVFFVLGASAVISPLPLGGITNVDLLVLVGASLLFWIFGKVIRKMTFTRTEGAVMFLAYVAYTVYLISAA
ncbi:MAG: calcium/sodium antiporter [Bacteroides sp.]|nr:calcium/sodium antiporter [Barnesiella sp.]MBD5369367.1 calcium/sodium antiporter [Bacteroides sp.]